MVNEWFAPGEIIFDRKTVLWLLENIACFREGIWPPDWSSYIDPAVRSHVNSKPPGLLAHETAIELDERLTKCRPLDGLFVEAIYSWNRSPEYISGLSNYSVEEVDRRVGRALNYISSGRDRRWHNTKKRKAVNYKDWINHRRKG